MGARNPAGVLSLAFAHDPYSEKGCTLKRVRSLDPIPEGTLHMTLAGKVSFMPYPSDGFFVAPPTMHKDHMTRVFIGQLPYNVTDMQLQWLCATFSNGGGVYFPERIMKRDETRGGKVPTGCIHAYCEPYVAYALQEALHKRVLIDDTGIWFAQNAAELEKLHDYCTTMKNNRRKRFQHRPYDSVVVQEATSTFVPPPPTYYQTTAPTPCAED
jgi:hypothetical protein